MNKIFLGLLLAVCVLGMALIMLNERLGSKSEPAATAPGESRMLEHRASVLPDEPLLPPFPGNAQAPQAPDAPGSQEPLAGGARILEREMATEALRPPAAAAARPAPANAPEPAEQLPGHAQQDSAQQNPGQAPAAAPEAPRAKAQPERRQAAESAPAKSPAPQASAAAGKAQGESAKSRNQTGAAPEITRAVVFARDTGATVRLTGNGPIKYRSMTLENPSRVVVDLEGDWQIKAPGVPKNPMVSNVRVGRLQDRTRIVIDLKEKPRTSRVILGKDHDSLDVRVDK